MFLKVFYNTSLQFNFSIVSGNGSSALRAYCGLMHILVKKLKQGPNARCSGGVRGHRIRLVGSQERSLHRITMEQVLFLNPKVDTCFSVCPSARPSHLCYHPGFWNNVEWILLAKNKQVLELLNSTYWYHYLILKESKRKKHN